MDLSPNQSKESTDLCEERDDQLSALESDCKPKDLSVKPNMKRLKPIPPPLNLISETSPDAPVSSALKEFAILATGPHSPLMQKNLPFRKRAHSIPDAMENAPLSAPPTIVTSFVIPAKQEPQVNVDSDSSPPLNLSLPPTPKLFSPSEPPVPVSTPSSDLPLPHHPMSMSQLVDSLHPGMMPYYRPPPWSPFLTSAPAPGVTPHCHWSNGPPSALLSPAPSSLGSQEDLRLPLPLPLPLPMPHSLPTLSLPPHNACDSDFWRLPWPQPVWHCFQYGTLLKFSICPELTVRAEEIYHCSELKNLIPERIGSLCVQGIEPSDGISGTVDVKFSGVYQGFAGDIHLVATCLMSQTFYALEKGWCALSPDAVLRHYGMQCPLLECGDYCPLPPKLPPVSSPGICDKFRRFSFSPEELNSSQSHQQPPGPYILSPPSTPTQKSYHNQPQTSVQYSKPQKGSKQRSSGSHQNGPKTSQKMTNKAPLDPDRPKRPMNAFMLFAKQHRLKLIQMHPGKDNRFVSVILGEAWRQLPADQKEVFITEAKALSHERKRLHPECWKRKRSQSTS